MATSILNNGGNRQIQVAQRQIRKGFFQRVGEYLGVIPQETGPRTINRRDIYQGQTPQHLAVQKSMNKVVGGRAPTGLRTLPPDQDIVAFLNQVSKNGINI